jgi:hypothetical protein
LTPASVDAGGVRPRCAADLAVATRERHGANADNQELKYHIQTTPRRLPSTRSAPPEAIAPWERPSSAALARLRRTARTGANLFAELLQTVCSCSLGQITRALYEGGGQYGGACSFAYRVMSLVVGSPEPLSMLEAEEITPDPEFTVTTAYPAVTLVSPAPSRYGSWY